MNFVYQKYSNKGLRRKENQDSIDIAKITDNSCLFVLADGIGSLYNGKHASSIAVKEFKNTVIENANKNPGFWGNRSNIFLEGVSNVNIQLNKAMKKFNKGSLGSTLLALLLHNRGYHVGWLGDSKFYHIRQNKIINVSRDHSLGVRSIEEEFDLCENEIAAPSISSNCISRFVYSGYSGFNIKPMEFISDTRIKKNDTFLLCSDGVSKYMTNKDITNFLNSTNNVSLILEIIVKHVLSLGADDNFSLIIIRAA